MPNPSSPDIAILSPDFIERRIYLIRRQKIMLDSDLAELYGVTTKRLNQQCGGILPGSPAILCFN
jgi:hypothetical protein